MRQNKIVPAALVLAQVGWTAATMMAATSEARAQAPAVTSPAVSGRPVCKAGSRRGAPQETIHRGLHQMPPNIPVPVPPDAKFVTDYQPQYAGAKQMTY